MKKNRLVCFLTVFILFAVSACGNKDAVSTDMGEVGNADADSSDILIDTLEYFLSEDADGDLIPVKDDESDRAQNEESNLLQEDEPGWFQDVEMSPDPDAESYNQISATIYYGNGASDKLNTEVSVMEQLTAENLIDALASYNIVSLGTKVNSFTEEEKNGNKVLYLDLDKSFHDYLKTMNSKSEKIILASLTATFLEAYDAQSIIITVDGKTLETNNDTYEKPFGYAREYIDAAPADN